MKEVSKPKEVKDKPLTVKEAKELILWMKSQKILSFSYNGLAVNFHPMALNELANIKEDKKNNKKSKAEAPAPVETDEDILFDAVE